MIIQYFKFMTRRIEISPWAFTFLTTDRVLTTAYMICELCTKKGFKRLIYSGWVCRFQFLVICTAIYCYISILNARFSKKKLILVQSHRSYRVQFWSTISAWKFTKSSKTQIPHRRNSHPDKSVRFFSNF